MPRSRYAVSYTHLDVYKRQALQGRGFVLPDDVKALAVAILAHRLMLGSEARLRGRSAADVVQAVLARIAVPVE